MEALPYNCLIYAIQLLEPGSIKLFGQYSGVELDGS